MVKTSEDVRSPADATLPPLGEAAPPVADAPPVAEMIAKLLAGHAERGLRTSAVKTYRGLGVRLAWGYCRT